MTLAEEQTLTEQWARDCRAGQCTYPSPEGRPRSTDGCPGYHATRYLERGQTVMRYAICPRHARWWRAEQIRIRERRRKQAAAPVRGSSWRKDAEE